MTLFFCEYHSDSVSFGGVDGVGGMNFVQSGYRKQIPMDTFVMFYFETKTDYTANSAAFLFTLFCPIQ